MEKDKFYMTRHFADILRTVTLREWESLRGWEKDYVAGGVEPISGGFRKFVMEKAQSIFENGDHSWNNIEHWCPELPVLNWKY